MMQDGAHTFQLLVLERNSYKMTTEYNPKDRFKAISTGRLWCESLVIFIIHADK